MPVAGPLDLKATLESGQVFRWELHDGCYWGVIGGHGYVLRQDGGGVRVRTDVERPNPWPLPSKGRGIDEARRSVGAFLRLDDDFEATCREMEDDACLREALAACRGLRILRQEPWECLASFICSSVSNIPRISRDLRRVAETYGESLELEDRVLHRFPTAERLAEVGEAALARLGLGFRAAYVAAAAEAVAGGRLDLASLRQASYAEAKVALMSLRGVGEKVADCVLLFSLDRLEAFPLDRWVRRALADWYGQGERVRYADSLAWAQARWGRRAGYANQYLFNYRRSLG
ncbi:MAG: 8-oxoguanine DNA glycosylase [Chloroflexi bacterium]|nr:8-oxoguanine DNA glycosylase [Chloroflexota bacterium]